MSVGGMNTVVTPRVRKASTIVAGDVSSSSTWHPPCARIGSR
jgi:hypothetical protein